MSVRFRHQALFGSREWNLCCRQSLDDSAQHFQRWRVGGEFSRCRQLAAQTEQYSKQHFQTAKPVGGTQPAAALPWSPVRAKT